MEEEKEIKTTTEVSNPQQVVTTRRVVKEPAVKTEHPQQVFETKKSIFRTYQIVWYVLGVIETLLIFRFFLKVVAADAGSGFANLIYAVSDPFALPFIGVLRISSAPSTGAVVEWTTLLAMAVYWVIAYGLVRLLQFIKPVTPQEVERTVDSQ